MGGRWLEVVGGHRKQWQGYGSVTSQPPERKREATPPPASHTTLSSLKNPRSPHLEAHEQQNCVGEIGPLDLGHRHYQHLLAVRTLSVHAARGSGASVA